MQPDTFFFPPTKAEHANVVFAILGRALALAARFESGCRALSSFIQLKEEPSPLDSEESLRAFSDRLARTQLAQVTRHLADHITPHISVFEVLNQARMARNEVVHELPLGFEYWAYDENPWDDQLRALRKAVQLIAGGDQLVSLVVSEITNEPLPTVAAIQEYPNTLTEWVCSLE
jgi:hypothetical protein